MDILASKRIHCIGIGGIGVSALAELWRAQGKEVSGSDVEESEITAALQAQGVQVIYRDRVSEASETRSPDIIVYSDAVPDDDPERVAARVHGVPEMSYAQALGEVSRDYRTIVVTGTHGKSTTTAMLGLMLEAAGFDPLVIVGTRVPQWRNLNLRVPRDYANALRAANDANIGEIRGEAFAPSFFVVEGDDYRDHFLELQPYAVVVTNIEYDHPDYFRDLAHTVESFRKLVEKVPGGGWVMLNNDDKGCRLLLRHLERSAKHEVERSLTLPKARDEISRSARNDSGVAKWITYGRGSEVFRTLKLQVPGEFNRYNAAAAATCAMELGVPRGMVEKAAHEFRGVWRRFEIVGELDYANDLRPANNTNIRAIRGEAFAPSPITIISDYAHHPTAIAATMKAAREAYPGRRLVLVFQPHQHSRTKHLFNDFVDALSAKGGSASGGKDTADLVIVSEIYAVKGRTEDRDVSSRDLVESIKSNNLITQLLNNSILYGGDLQETTRVVFEQIKPGDVVIFMGAGDIDQLAREIMLVEFGKV